MNHSFNKSVIVVLAVILVTCCKLMGQDRAGSPIQSKLQNHNLTLNEAIRLSIQNSKQLKLSSAKIDEAAANYQEMWNNHLPDAKISGSYLMLKSPDVSLKVKLGSGGPGAGSAIKVDRAAYGIANASVPVFSGFRIKYGVESAKYLEKAARLDADYDKEEVIQNTINAFSNLYKSFKTIELLNENSKQQEARIKDFSNLEQNGIMSHNDVLKIQLQQSNIQLSLLEAKNNYNITCVNMCLMLGLESGTDLIPDTTAFRLVPDAGTLTQWEVIAGQNRKDIAALASREQAADFGIKATKGEYYPGLAVTGGYIAADIPNLVTITNAFNLGLGLQYNIASLWKTGAKIDAATARMHQLQTTKAILSERIALQINQAYQNYLLCNQKIYVYAKAVEQSNENYRITKSKQENNLVTATELLEADIAQLQAMLNYTFATVDVTVAYHQLQQVAGTLSVDYQSSK